ncbi:MAG: nuclear transport factor 2 family protein [Bacteroidetes bacterium]|nr:nuclear transport factor 2 family protein [Bacteroidota bacterium]
MKSLFILSFTFFLSATLFAQQTSADAIKQTINTMLSAMRKGDSNLLRSVLAKDVELQSVAADKMGKITLSTTSANDLVTSIGTPHADVYDERIIFSDIKIDGPLASVRAPYKFYLGNTFSHCGVNFFQLTKTKDGWKIIHIGYTVATDNCKI